MSLGLPNNSENPNKGYSILLGVSMRSRLPLEIQILSLHITLAIELTHKDKHQLCLHELEALDDKRLQAQQEIELYQARITKAFNKKVKKQIFKKGDHVLAVK